jgi:hypothetical protein
MAKVAKARRTAGDVYDVAYPWTSAYDRGVSGKYLDGLVRGGYEVHCDNNGHDVPRYVVGKLVDGEIVWRPTERP